MLWPGSGNIPAAAQSMSALQNRLAMRDLSCTFKDGAPKYFVNIFLKGSRKTFTKFWQPGLSTTAMRAKDCSTKYDTTKENWKGTASKKRWKVVEATMLQTGKASRASPPSIQRVSGRCDNLVSVQSASYSIRLKFTSREVVCSSKTMPYVGKTC